MATTGTIESEAGSNIVGNNTRRVTIATDDPTAVNVAALAAAPAVASPPTSTARLLSAAGTNGDTTNVKASAGRLYTVVGYNAAASLRYLKFYNKATAPTVGTDTPVLTIPLPPATGFAFDFPGLGFTLGIGFGITTAVADNSVAFSTAADILGLNVVYA